MSDYKPQPLPDWSAIIAEKDEHIRRITLDYLAEVGQLLDEITRLRAEVERLRAALEEIASGEYGGIVLTSFPPQDPAVNRARAALNGEPRT